MGASQGSGLTHAEFPESAPWPGCSGFGNRTADMRLTGIDISGFLKGRPNLRRGTVYDASLAGHFVQSVGCDLTLTPDISKENRSGSKARYYSS